MTKHILIDAVHTDETRVVIINDDQIEDFDFVTTSKAQVKGNIYLAKITRVEPSLQAAFVEYGGGKQGFLPFSEIHPDYYQIPVADKQRLLAEEEAESEREEEEEEEALEQRDKPRRGRRSRRGGRSASESGEDAEHDASTENGEPYSDDDHAQASDDDGQGEDGDIDYQAAKSETYVVRSDIVENDESEAESDESASTEVDAQEGEAAETDANESEENGEQSSDGERERPRRGRRGGRNRGRDRGERQSSDDDGDEDEETEVETVSENDLDVPQQRRKGNLFKRYRIQEVIKRNQIVLVQVIKEERGNKGCSLSTYISLAGRYCVLMPNSPKGGGVSRKIGNGEQRKKLKEVVAELRDQRGLSAIIRTAGIDRTKTEIKRDYEYLVTLWAQIREDTIKSNAPALIYEESDIIKRTIRDLYTSDIDSVMVQGEQAYKDAKNFMKLIMPSHAPRVKQYKEPTPIFSAYDIEPQLASIYEQTAKLPSGGYIVLQQTEALISIDVNSGRSTTERNVEETAIKTNLEAAREIARQLRLRDLAGLVVIDFIDMYYGKNKRNLERAVKDALKMDRAKIQVSRISAFGLMELSRQRLRPSIAESSTMVCPHCLGNGTIRSVETVAIQIIRLVEREAASGEYTSLRVFTYPGAALHLLNEKRHMIQRLEEQYNITLIIDIDNTVVPGHFRIMKTTADGKEILHREEGLSDKRKGRRGRRGGRGRGRENESSSDDNSRDDDDDTNESHEETNPNEERETPAREHRSRDGRNHRPRKPFNESTESDDETESDDAQPESGEDSEKPRRNSRNRRGSRGGRRRRGNREERNEDGSPREPREPRESNTESSNESVADNANAPAQDEPVKKTMSFAPEPRAEVIHFEESSTDTANEVDDERPKRKGWWNRVTES